MNYGEMLANSIISNDGSTYAKNASDSLSAALDAGKAADEMSRNMIANASFATDSLVKAVGTASTTTKDKDGNITTTPGTGFAGMAESIKDFTGQNFDLQNAINENTSEYNNKTFDVILEAQKEQYELMANNNSFKNLEASTDIKINETLAKNNSSLNIGKVKAYLTNPNLINQAVKNGELTDADAVMLKNMQQQGISDAVAQSNKLRLMKEYTDNGWLTDENLFELAKIRSEDPFAKLSGLSTIDIYTKLAAEQRVARNQGDLTNDMFDLNYSVNRNLLNGNRAINNSQYSNNQANGNIVNNSSIRTNQANSNTATNQNTPNQQEENTSNELDDNTSQYVSNIRFDNGKTQIDFTPEGEQLKMQHIDNFNNFSNEELFNPGRNTSDIWEATKDAGKAVLSSPAAWLVLGGGGIGLGVKFLGGMVLKHSPKLLGLAKDGAIATMEYVLSDILSADGKEAMESAEKLGKDIQALKEERNSKLSKTKDEAARLKIRKDYESKKAELYKNNPIFGNENTSKWMRENGYTTKIQKAFAKNDTKELERLAKEVSNNKEFQRLARANAATNRTALQGAKTAAGRTIKSTFTGKIGMGGIILSALPFAGGVAYNLLGSEDEDKNENTYEKFENGLNELRQFNPEKRDRRNWENSGEDTSSNFITNFNGHTGNNTNIFLRSFDYEAIRRDIANDYKNGKISQKEAQLRTQRINRAQKAAEAVEFQDNIVRQAELQNPNSRANALNTPITENPDDLENNIESRAKHNAQINNIPTTINKQLDGGNQYHRDTGNISPNAGLLLSSVTGRNVTEVNVQGIKFPVATELSGGDKISNDFLKMKDAPEGTIVPISAAVIKDNIVSILNNNDLGTADFYKYLKDNGFDEQLKLIDTYMQSGKNGKTKAYEILQDNILPMIAEAASKYKPGSIAIKEGSSRVNNKDLAQLIGGKKDYSVDRLNNKLLNDIEYTFKLQQYMRESPEFFNTFITAHLFGNSEKIKKRINEYENNKKIINKNNKQ